MNTEEKHLTGYPSIDKPWLKYYSEKVTNANIPSCSVYKNIYEKNRSHPKDIALEFFNAKITYEEMFSEVDKVATAFIKYGVKKNDKVILFTSSMPEIIIAILALGKIGAVANMVSPLFEEEQIIARTNETEATLMIVMEQLWSKIAGIVDELCVKTIAVVSVTDSMPMLKKNIARLKVKSDIKYTDSIVKWRNFIEKYSDDSISVDDVYEAELPFIMVYSSGTTGASKGIVLTHDGINATISHYVSPDFPYERGDRYLQMIPIWFSTGIVISCLMPLCLGITVILEPIFNAKSFCLDMHKYKPTMTLVATSQWLPFLEDKKMSKTDFSFLRYPITGGEQLLSRVEHRINDFLSERKCQAQILQGYGMCELGGTVATNTNLYKKSGSSGLPIKGVTVAAFDLETNKEMMYNQRGELRVISPARMKYYYKNEKATKDFFYVDESGRMWGCTGDIGYIDEDGYIFVLGRASDFFISSMGKKVYNFDIESVVHKSPNIANCEVVGVETEEGYSVPVVHMIKENTCSVTEDELIKEIHKLCTENLEPDSVPYGYKICTSFPVKTSGKRDMEKIKQDREGLLNVKDGHIINVQL